MRVLIQCGDNFENTRRVLALATLLRKAGHQPIAGVYTKEYGAPFQALGFDVLPLNRFRPWLGGFSSHRELGFSPDLTELMPMQESSDQFSGDGPPSDRNARSAIAHLLAGYRALEASKAEALVVWNGVTGHFANAFRCLKEKHGLAGGFLERGLISDGVYFDPRGTNGWASSARGAALGSQEERDERRARHQVAADVHFPSLVKETYMARAQRDRAKIVFVPLQVQRDSNILLHSIRIKTMRQLVIEAITLRDRWFPGYRLLVRPHPEEAPEELLNLPKTNGLLIDSKGSLNDVLAHAAATVTVNSTVGLEAALFGSLPIVFGEGIYAREPFVFRPEQGTDDGPSQHLSMLRDAPNQVWQQVSDFMIALLDRNLVQPLRRNISEPREMLEAFAGTRAVEPHDRSPTFSLARAEFEQLEGPVHCHVLSSLSQPKNLDYRRLRRTPLSSDIESMLKAIFELDRPLLARRGAWSPEFHIAIAGGDISREIAARYKIVFTPEFALHPIMSQGSLRRRGRPDRHLRALLW